ncbi:MAG: hypothetical protein KAT33_00840 [Bacteroidales bacterium]|nr:hypothetical protein [Bacteroidales bacterium]
MCKLTDKFAISRFPMGGVFASIEGFIEKSKMKALRVIKCRTESPVFDKNPPELIIEAEPGNLNFEYYLESVFVCILSILYGYLLPYV